MRKQCLFDPNHLIDELGYTKHLLNCQSKLKKDWRKCRYSDAHWLLYKYIDFHEKYECPYNPLYVQNPQRFVEEREKQIRKRLAQSKSKNSFKSQSILSSMRQDSQLNSIVESSLHSPEESINFGQISIIEKSKNYNSGEALDQNETVKQQKVQSIIMRGEQQHFHNGIFKKQKQLWAEPNFQSFQKQFRLKWLTNKSKMNLKQENGLQKKEESFTEQDQDEITIENISSKYLEIDQD